MNKTMSNTVHDLLKHQEDSNFQVDMTGEGGRKKTWTLLNAKTGNKNVQVCKSDHTLLPEEV
jgi:hypothetical protein